MRRLNLSSELLNNFSNKEVMKVARRVSAHGCESLLIFGDFPVVKDDAKWVKNDQKRRGMG